MASVFTRMIAGELPARFVWKDDVCVAFVSMAPLQPGHVLVVPRDEVEHWIDLDLGTWEHTTRVAKAIGTALQRAYEPAQVGLMIAGLEVSHVHLHVVPINDVHDLDVANADPDPDEDAVEEAAQTIRAALRELGAAQVPG